MPQITAYVSEEVRVAVEAAAAARRWSVSTFVADVLEAALREPGIPLSGGGAREAGRPNTAFQASTSGSRNADPHFKPYPKPGGKA